MSLAELEKGIWINNVIVLIIKKSKNNLKEVEQEINFKN